MRNFERRKRIFLVSLNYAKVLNPQGNYKGYQTKMLLKFQYPNRIVET